MRIYPASHYTMGGLWVDYNLMSTIPGLFVLGEANFSDHGANRLGASALMQGLADGYFVLPYTIGNYLAGAKPGERRRPTHAEFEEAEARGRASGIEQLLAIKGKRTVDVVPPRARQASCGSTAAWRATRAGLETRAREDPARCARSSGRTCTCPGTGDELNQSLEKAGRVADFLELGELMCRDALDARGVVRRPLPRGVPDAGRRGAARRRAASATSRRGSDRATAQPQIRHEEPLAFENVHLAHAELQVMNLHAPRLAPDRTPTSPGQFVTLRGDGRRPAHVVPRDARRRQRGAHRDGRGPDRLRPRLPRGHLRHVRRRDQRPAARRPSRAPRPASSTCASSRTATTIVIEPWRAKAFPVIKDLVVDRSAFDRIIAARRLHLGADRRRAGRERDPRPEGERRPRDGRRRLHRLRRLRGRVPERVGVALHRREGRAPRPPAAGPARALDARRSRMVEQMDAEGFGSCTNHGECEAACPKGISVRFIAQMNADYLRARLRRGRRVPQAQRRRRRVGRRTAGIAPAAALRFEGRIP